MDRLYTIHFWRIHVIREETNEQQATSRLEHLWPEFWRSMARESKMKENEKLWLENASNLRAIYFIDLEEKKFKDMIKNAREKLEVPVAPAMPSVRANIKYGQHVEEMIMITSQN